MRIVCMYSEAELRNTARSKRGRDGKNHTNEGSRVAVVYAISPSTWKADSWIFVSSRPGWFYRASSRTAEAAQRNPVSKNNNQPTNQTHKQK